jgi:hypothetical protein
MKPGTGYLVMASHLPLKRTTATVRFFRGVSAVHKQPDDRMAGWAVVRGRAGS